MTTDNRTNEPTEATEAMILAALNAYSSKGLEIDGYGPTDEYPSLDMWGERFASQMRAALVAAQGAAPQADALPSNRENCPGSGGHAGCGNFCSMCFLTAPVLPSSGVDEDAREFRFTDAQWLEYQGIPMQGYSHRHHLENVFNEWLKEQGRGHG